MVAINIFMEKSFFKTHQFKEVKNYPAKIAFSTIAWVFNMILLHHNSGFGTKKPITNLN